MFSRPNVDPEKRINLAEFQEAVPLLRRWGLDVKDAKATFEEIDVHKEGSVLFDEFAGWAIQNKLDLEDEDD